MALYNHHLETFLKVADSGSFRKAAESLYISPTAVQKQIDLLEANTGAKLFQRTSRGLILTGAGKSLYADASYLLAFSAEAEQRMHSYQETSYTELRAVSSPISPLLCVKTLWPHIHRADPSYRLIIVPRGDDPMTKRESIRNLGITADLIETAYDEERNREAGLNWLEFTKIPLGILVPIYHPLAERRTVGISDLVSTKTPVIIPKRGLNRYADEVRNELVERRTAEIIEIDDYTADAYNECIRSDCAMLTLNPIPVHPLLVYKKAAWDYRVPYGLLFSSASSPVILDFIRIMRRLLENEAIRKEMYQCFPEI